VVLQCIGHVLLDVERLLKDATAKETVVTPPRPESICRGGFQTRPYRIPVFTKMTSEDCAIV